jgi:hypothetical protein
MLEDNYPSLQHMSQGKVPFLSARLAPDSSFSLPIPIMYISMFVELRTSDETRWTGPFFVWSVA